MIIEKFIEYLVLNSSYFYGEKGALYAFMEDFLKEVKINE